MKRVVLKKGRENPLPPILPSPSLMKKNSESLVFVINPIIETRQVERYQDNIQSDGPDYYFEMVKTRVQDIVNESGWDKAKEHPEIKRLLQAAIEGISEYL